jgi:alpha-tubulin suppressor-like RCC1 family protein/pimeloyl-ACP methyl ester carboxylesterase
LTLAACREIQQPPSPYKITLEYVSGDNQQGPQGGVLPDSLAVRAVGSDGNAGVGARIRWTSAPQDVAFSDSITTTGHSGLAAVRVTLPKRPGTVTVTARLVTDTSQVVGFTVQAEPTPQVGDTVQPHHPDTAVLTVSSGARVIVPPGAFDVPIELQIADASLPDSAPHALAALEVSIRGVGGALRQSSTIRARGVGAERKKFFVTFPILRVARALDAILLFSKAVTSPWQFVADATFDAALGLSRVALNVVENLTFRLLYVRYEQPLCEGLYRLRDLAPPSDDGLRVVLVHGWQWDKPTCAGFDGDLAEEAFRSFLDRPNSEVLPPSHFSVSTFTYPTSQSPETAALALANTLDADASQAPVVFLGHSMGGLVVRRAAQLMTRKKVRGVITLGSPHLGTDLATGRLPDDKPAQLLACLADHATSSSPGHRSSDESQIMGIDPSHLTVLELGVAAFVSTEGARALVPGSIFLQVLNAPDLDKVPTVGFAGDVSDALFISPLGQRRNFYLLSHCVLEVEWSKPANDGLVPVVSALPPQLARAHVWPRFDHSQLHEGTTDVAVDAEYFDSLTSAILSVSPTWLSGFIRLSGDPIPNATVRLDAEDADPVPWSATTDSDGRYRFTLIEPGAYRITATAVTSTDTAEVSASLLLRAGEVRTLDLDVAPEGGATGTIVVATLTDAEEPHPTGLMLSISGLADVPIGPADTVIAGGLAAGDYEVRLANIPAECRVGPPNPRVVSIVPPDTARTSFLLQCSQLSVFSQIAAGADHTCALASTGSGLCWGYNYYGQAGVASQDHSFSTPKLTLTAERFSSLMLGEHHTCALSLAQRLYCWGSNGQGQLGDGTIIDKRVPTPVAVELSPSSVTAGLWHTCAVVDGAAYCWGNNLYGQLGDGTTERRWTPTRVAGELEWIALAAGTFRTCGLVSGGSAYCWGSGWGKLPSPVPGGIRFSTLVAGAHHACGLAVSGGAYCWGSNLFGQLGTGSSGIGSTTPLPVAGGLAVASLAAGEMHSCAVAADGAAYCWGYNYYGQLGTGDNVTTPFPTPVAGNHPFRQLEAGSYHTCGITRDNVAFCWGGGHFGKLGTGVSTSTNIPVRVAGQR